MNLKKIKEELDNCKNPLFIFDDDPDGLSSFLMLRKYKETGRFIIVKTSPKLDKFFAERALKYEPDKIFVCDIAMIDDDFFDKVKIPIIWIDHHKPAENVPSHCKYFNPRIKEPDSYFPTSYLVYKALNKFPLIASVGCISDAMVPDFISKVPQDLLNGKKDVWDIRFNSDLGKLCSYFSFCMKGSTVKVNKIVNALTKVDDVTELIKQNQEDAVYVMKHVKKISETYDEIKEGVAKVKSKNKLFVYIYSNDKHSITKELANEVSYMHPDKIVMVGRDRAGTIKMSVRSKTVPILPIIEKIFSTGNVRGYGGGHEYACGVVLENYDFDKFLEAFEEEL